MAKSKMTKYEKVSTILSVVAIVLAIISPVVTYYWLDPELRNFRRRAKLQVTDIRPQIFVDAKGAFTVQRKGETIERIPITPGPLHDYELEITNLGELPGKEIKIVLEKNKCPGDESSNSEDFSFEPLIPYDLVHKGSQAFITLGRALAPQDNLRMVFKRAPLKVAVSNEFGETTFLQPLVFGQLCARYIPQSLELQIKPQK